MRDWIFGYQSSNTRRPGIFGLGDSKVGFGASFLKSKPSGISLLLFLPGRAAAGIENLVQVAEFGSSRQL
jgi:hypothetical protein